MDLLNFQFFSAFNTIYYFSIVVIGLSVGSFLNVVIVRLPKMLVETDMKQALIRPTFNLLLPASHCPACQHPLAIQHNIPIFSYFLLKGKCRYCQQAIAWQYPVVEILTALVSLIVALRFEVGLQMVAALFLSWCLIALAWIDAKYLFLPDNITLPLLWLGLVLSLLTVFVSPAQAILGAVTGYGVLRLVYAVYKLFTHKEGLGFGDFKLLAVFGAWLGIEALPFIIILASFTGACFGIYLMKFHHWSRNRPLPFGPFLALAGWLALLWGPQIPHLY